MAIWLKQSTSVVLSFGPFLLNSDGVTLVVNLVGTGANQTENTSTGIRLSKNGGAFAARHATATASTYDAFGNYLVTLDTTDTGTLGALRVQFADGAHFCPVWQDFEIVAANIYDSFVGGGDVLDISAIQILGTAISTPATAGILDVNLKNIANAAVSTSSAQLGVNAVNLGGTAQTGRDIGASVLLSSGTGTGQLDFTSGVVKANLAQILGTALTETAGLLAGGFKQFFNIASPTSTLNTITTVTTTTTATNLTNAPTAGDFTATMKTSLNNATPSVTVSDKTGFSLSAAGVQAIWDALTSALTTVGSIGKLLVTDIDATISSRTKPADTQARVTLVDTVTVTTTATNLTNAPTSGDFTATMKTSLNSATPTVTAGTVSDKTGYSLAASGLDSITATRPSGIATTFPQMLVLLYYRFFGKSTLTATQLKTYAANGSTVVSTQTVSDDNVTQTQGEAS